MITKELTTIFNRQTEKFFGIDYYANICNGSKESFDYYSTPLDFYPLANSDRIEKSEMKEKVLIDKIKQQEESKYFGFFQNPDIFDCYQNISPVLTALKSKDHGLFIESNSPGLINQIEVLNAFSKSNPFLLALPVANLEGVEESFNSANSDLKHVEKIVKTVSKNNIIFGFVIKPILPFINDDIDHFEAFLNKLIQLKPAFIYPTFSVHFDSRKLNNYYAYIDRNMPELKSKIFDVYGKKNIWQSKNIEQLKKSFIFTMKKTNIKYTMKDIIGLYKMNSFSEQISLF